MKQPNFKKYLIIFATVFAALLVLMAGFNWLVDPYGIYGSPKINGFNALKPEEPTHARMSKAYLVRQIKPQAIVLGTSAVEWGIDPDHPGWAYQPVFNLGIPGADIYEILRYMQHANQVQPLKQVVLGLDFEAFITTSEAADPATENRLAVNYDGKVNSSLKTLGEKIATLFSVSTLGGSLNTVRQQKNNLVYKADGMYAPLPRNIAALDGYRGIFKIEESSYTEIPWRQNFDFQHITADPSPFTCFRQILQLAYQDNIDLRMFIAPSHARLWELVNDYGIWPNVEQWKRELVSINEEEAAKYGKTPFPLWDFTGYNQYTMEAVPPVGDTTTVMRWWNDDRHFSVELGDMMLDRIFGFSDPARAVPDDFGVLLNSGDIESVLRQIDLGRQDYEKTHPEDVAEVQSLIP